MPATRLARLAGFAYRRRRLVLGRWVAALFAAFALVAVAGGDWSADYNTPGSQSKAAADALEQRFPDALARHGRRGLAGSGDEPAATFLRAGRDAARASATRPPRPQISPKDVAVARLPLTMLPADVPKPTGKRLLDMRAAAAHGAVNVELGGEVIQNAAAGPDLLRGARPDGRRRSSCCSRSARVVAAGLPLLLALFGLGIASALIGAAGRDPPHARLGLDGRRDARHRRRHRLRAADPHPPPRRARARREPSTRRSSRPSPRPAAAC